MKAPKISLTQAQANQAARLMRTIPAKRPGELNAEYTRRLYMSQFCPDGKVVWPTVLK